MNQADNNRYCDVRGCRFAGSHVTNHHRCGTCGESGHGQIECGDPNALQNLRNQHIENQVLPQHIWCNLDGCDSRMFHTTRAHHCPNCGKNHSIRECIIQIFEDQFRRFGRDNDIEPYTQYINNTLNNIDNNNINNGIFIETYAGMGCFLYIRARMNQPIMSLFLHSDNQGQYAPHLDDRPCRDTFIEGCIRVEDISPDNMLVLQRQIYDDNNNINHGGGGPAADMNDGGDDGAAAALVLLEHGHDALNAPNGNMIHCPLCRGEVNTEEAMRIRGSTDRCSVCYDNNVEMFFPECEHACVCQVCFSHLD
jgi:hypothetical protein